VQGVYLRGLAGSAGLQACLEESMVTVTRNTGMLLLGIYLILVGITGLVSIPVPFALHAILALLAGVFILLGR
jgi:hypothetical protein